jgi:FtsP/CotA-like multicopper oxidase with cupredoxin domain
MDSIYSLALGRRAVLKSGSAIAVCAALPTWARPATAEGLERRLTARPGFAQLRVAPGPRTEIWGYDGAAPGPQLRLRQGDTLRIAVENRLEQETTVHWHGVRVPNAMDGVPHLTQSPIASGETFVYEFEVPDAGTYWYHPHHNSSQQVGRGLYGALIVEERDPYPVDRELTWLLGDWRLLPNGDISDDFDAFMDASHGGRVGNTVTINGRAPEPVPVRAGERVRLRLINAANARIFGLRFEGHRPWVIALDGQPVEPHEPEDGLIVLGPAMRVDLVLDLMGGSGERFTVRDAFYKGLEFDLTELAYGAEPPLRAAASGPPPALPANTMPEPDLGRAGRHEVLFEGGMMGGLRRAMVAGHRADMREMMKHRVVWAVNGVAAVGHALEPVATVARGGACLLELRNDTRWHHPIHLHGHSFRVLSRNGKPTARREWQDTVLLQPEERAEIAFVADNPGDWMLHCHILEHQAAGMMAVLRVT